MPNRADNSTDRTPFLDIRGLSVSFGGVTALRDVSFEVTRGQICGLIGPNGAGKTTLFNCLSQLYHYQSGEIRLRGKLLAGEPRHKLSSLGVGRTFQNLALFREMSVRDNIRVGGHCRTHTGFVANIFRWPSVVSEERDLDARTDSYIEFLGLEHVASEPVMNLPFGTQKRVEFARALATEPELLLLDEPACGLNHEEVGALENVIRQARERFKVTVLLVEHHMNLVMRISDQVVALNFGQKIADGTPKQVQTNPEVIRAYLGGT